jgi:hypothetical protein
MEFSVAVRKRDAPFGDSFVKPNKQKQGPSILNIEN